MQISQRLIDSSEAKTSGFQFANFCSLFLKCEPLNPELQFCTNKFENNNISRIAVASIIPIIIQFLRTFPASFLAPSESQDTSHDNHFVYFRVGPQFSCIPSR